MYKKYKRKSTIGIILEVEETDFIVMHKSNSKLLTVEYYVDNILYIEKVIAKYVDPLDLKKLKVNKRIEVCYDVDNPQNIFLPYYSSIMQLLK